MNRQRLCQGLSRVWIGRAFIRRASIVVAIVMLLSMAFPTNVLAMDFSSQPVNNAANNQGMSQVANLVAPEPDTKITIYLRPEAGKNKVGYGVSGDAVTVLEQVSDNQSVTWNHIRFEAPPYAEGWVQSSFISLGDPLSQAQSQNPVNQRPTGNQYLGGNREGGQLQRPQGQQTQGYSQQNQY